MKQPGDIERKSITSSISDSGCGCSSGSGLLETVRQVITGGSDLETHFEYDNNGNQTRVTDAQNRVTDYEYNVMNEMTKVIDPLLNETTYAYNKLGHLTKVVDADAHEVDYSYDHFGRMTKQEDEVGDVTYAYDHRGNMTQVTDGNGKTYTYAYTTRNRLTKMTDPLDKETHYFYDSIGRATKTAAGASGTIDPVEYFYSGTTGQMTRVKYTNDAHEDEVEYYYDLAGQMTRVDDWMGGVGNSDGHFFYYDVMGRVTKYRDFDHEAMNPKEMTYSYAANGQLTSTTDFNGFTTAYTYDARHRLSTVTVGGKTWSYAYNAYNMPMSVTMPNGIVTEYVYDDVGRMTKIEHKDGATVLRGWTKTLGDDGGITRITQDSGAYWDYDYDARHRLTEAWYRNANNLALCREKYTYDPGDNVLTKTTPFIEDFDDGNYTGWTTYGTWSAGSGFMQNSVSGSWSTFFRSHSEADFEMQVSYRRDSSSGNLQLRPRWINSNSARVNVVITPSQIQIYEYDGSTHTMLGWASASSTQHTWYDVYLKISGSNLEVWRGPKGGTLSHVLSVSNIASVLTTDLLRFEVAPNAQYSYDDIIVYSDELRSTTTFTHNDANEQTAMTVDGTTTNFAYDAWGRMTSRTRGSLAASMKYRYGDRLYEVTSNFPGEAPAVEYNYDGMGLRRAALVNGTDLTWWRWNGMSVYSEHEVSTSTPWDIESGDTIKTHFPGLGYAEPSGGSPMVTFKFYTTDHLGSVRGIWDGEWGSSVNNLATYDYTPYGDILQQSGLPLDVGFTGHHWDNHIQQYFAPFRFYSPTTLRWNMRDPLGFIDGPNVYAYVGGNPVMRVDMLGLSWLTAIGNFFASVWGGVCSVFKETPTNTYMDDAVAVTNQYNDAYSSVKYVTLPYEVIEIWNNLHTEVLDSQTRWQSDDPYELAGEIQHYYRGFSGSSGRVKGNAQRIYDHGMNHMPTVTPNVCR